MTRNDQPSDADSTPGTRFERYRPDDRGVSEILGAILLFGVLIALVVLVQVTAVPAWNQQIEFDHNQRVQEDVGDLANAIQRAGGADAAEAVAVELGVRYPSRVFLLNPAPASGSIRTVPRGEIRIANAVGSGEVRDFWDGTPVSYDTKAVVYRPDYNEYRNAPTTVYEHGTVFNAFEGNVTTIEQADQLVAGNDVDLVALTGGLQRTGVDATSVPVASTAGPTRTISVTGEANRDITITLRTTLAEREWRTVLADELASGHVESLTYDGSTSPGTVTLTLDGNVTYDLRTALVGVGERPDRPAPAYLERVAGGGEYVPIGSADRLTVEVRDKFNAPRSGVNVTYTVLSGDGEFQNDPTPGDRTYTVRSGADGQTSTVFYPLTDGTVLVRASAEFNGQPGLQETEIVRYAMTTTPPGEDASGTDPINPRNPSGVYLSDVSVSGDTATTTFTNLANSTREWSAIRVSFYYAQAATKESLNVVITPEGKTAISTRTGEPFQQIQPTPLSFAPSGQPGDSKRVTFRYPGEKLQGGDFFVVAVRYKGGGTATYFVAIPTGGGR